MKKILHFSCLVGTLILISCAGNPGQKDNNESQNVLNKTDPLPSWNEGSTKSRVIDFVTGTTTEGSPDFIPVSERIACFGNDGCLWCEKPIYVQLAFAIDRVKALAPEHPEWKSVQPFKALREGDIVAEPEEKHLNPFEEADEEEA